MTGYEELGIVPTEEDSQMDILLLFVLMIGAIANISYEIAYALVIGVGLSLVAVGGICAICRS